MPPALRFGGIELAAAGRVLQPRPWTTLQSDWAVELACRDLPPGPILELCAGHGAIGLDAAHRTGRAVVLVDDSLDACRCAAGNAATNGLRDRTEVRRAPLARALRRGERFPLILADPPYLPSGAVGRYPDDPVHAVDGGPDGLDRLRQIVALLPLHLHRGGAALVQVLGPSQAAEVAALAEAGAGLRAGEVRAHDDERAVIELRAR
jgi:release factor glutamine methyltransferase